MVRGTKAFPFTEQNDVCQLKNVGSTNPPKLSKLRPLALATDSVSQLYVRDHPTQTYIIKFEISEIGLGGVRAFTFWKITLS